MSNPYLAFVESNTSGTGQLFIRSARDLGLRPALLAADPARYRFVAEEDVEVVPVDTQDAAAVLEACRRLAANGGLAGVASSSEYYIEKAAHAARALGLPGPRPEAIRDCRDKHRQRRRLRAAGVGVPAFRLVRSAAGAASAAREIGWPVVVKPVEGTGSVGVRLCRNAAETEAHADSLLRRGCNERGLPIPRRALVEAVADGDEFSVETFGSEVVGVTQKHLGQAPWFLEVGHDYPAPMPRALQRQVAEVVRRSLAALRLGWGAAHVELRVAGSPGCPRITIIEVNPRLAGGYIPELVRLAHGIDLVANTIRLAVGRRTDLTKVCGRHASIRFLLPGAEGRFVGAEGLEIARRASGVTDVRVYPLPGERVARFGDFRERIGHVIASGDGAGAVQAALGQALQAVRLVIEASAEAPCGVSRRVVK